MGYSTRFNLSWEGQRGYEDQPNCKHKFDSPFCPQCGIPRGLTALDDVIGEFITASQDTYYGIQPDGKSVDECKWYDWREDTIAMSKHFPKVLFKLHGEGEENGNIWDAYFLNGKSQVKKARIMIDECDPEAWE